MPSRRYLSAASLDEALARLGHRLAVGAEDMTFQEVACEYEAVEHVGRLAATAFGEKPGQG